MTERLPNQCGPGELWVPGMHLDDEYPVPSEAELCDLWQEYDPSADVAAASEVYGVYAKPQRDIKAIASIDLCEVVRDTAVSLARASGLEVGRRGIYSADTWYHREISGKDIEESVIISGVRVLMHRGLVQPVEHVDAIASVMRSWRRQGIYCVANTSTLPGCEAGTIRHTLGRTLPGCFDALVLPRNHDGNGPVTKAMALEMITKDAGLGLAELPFVHIDDAPHHIAGFRQYYTDRADMKLFSPIYHGETVQDQTYQCATPFEAFLRTDQYFKKLGAKDI